MGRTPTKNKDGAELPELLMQAPTTEIELHVDTRIRFVTSVAEVANELCAFLGSLECGEMNAAEKADARRLAELGAMATGLLDSRTAKQAA